MKENFFGMMRLAFRRGIDFLVGLLAYLLYGFFWIFPIDVASALGGALGRILGPFLTGSTVASHNLALALPELSEAERKKIIRGMWDNLGRTLAELPHIYTLQNDPNGRIEYVDVDHLKPFLGSKIPLIFVGGHIGNWEVCPVALKNIGFPVAVVFRPPNNPWVNALLQFTRRLVAPLQISKSAGGLREMVKILAQDGQIGMLVDQKMNQGIPVPLFGMPAMTAPAAATLAYKFAAPLIPVRVERLKGAFFRATVFPPLPMPHTDDKEKDVLTVMTHVNNHLERWIRDRPEQWLWLHRRWPESGLRNKGSTSDTAQ